MFVNSKIGAEFRRELSSLPPFFQRFMIVSYDMQVTPTYPALVSPQNIPVILLQMAGLNPRDTVEGRLLSALTCGSVQEKEVLCDYQNTYKLDENGLNILIPESTNSDIGQVLHAKRVLSLDLFFGKQHAYEN
jgi:hypothetical protein